jgi:hypothetical protein
MPTYSIFPDGVEQETALDVAFFDGMSALRAAFPYTPIGKML